MFLQGYNVSVAMFSSETFRTFRNDPLQIGHLSNVTLQLQQRLCPLLQSMMGGIMYSIQTGHSSSCRRRLWNPSAMLHILGLWFGTNPSVLSERNINQFSMPIIILRIAGIVSYKMVQPVMTVWHTNVMVQASRVAGAMF
jgi:hypothetical protein